MTDLNDTDTSKDDENPADVADSPTLSDSPRADTPRADPPLSDPPQDDPPLAETDLAAPLARTTVVSSQGRGRRPGSPGVRWTLRLIAVGYVLILVALPVFTVTRTTFENGLHPVLTALQDPDLLSALRLSALVAVISVLINTLFGVGIAVLLVRYRFPGRRLLNAVIDLPISISPVVVGIALILVYGQNGWLGPTLTRLHIQIIFATPALIMATVIVALPLVAREVIPVLEEAGTEQDQAAQSLGANAAQRFVRITLPTIKWALAYGVVLSLARSLGEFGAVRVVSGSVAGSSQTLPLYVNNQYQQFGPIAQEAAFTAAFVLMLIAVLFIVVIAVLRPKDTEK